MDEKEQKNYDRQEERSSELQNTASLQPVNIKDKKGALILLLFNIGLVIYLELTIHLLIYHNIDGKIIYPVLFAVPTGSILTIITGMFSKRVNRLLHWLLTMVMCIIFQVQLVYFGVFKIFFSLQSLGLAEDAFTNFYREVLKAIRDNIGGLIILIFPLIILLRVVKRRINYNRRELKMQGILLFGLAGVHALVLLTLLLYGRTDYSPYDLYFYSKVPDLCGRQLGVITMTRLDVAGMLNNTEGLILADTVEIPAAHNVLPTIVPKAAASVVSSGSVTLNTSEPSVTPTPTPTPVDTSPNIMDIDFEAMAENETDDTIKTLDRYFASVEPTKKNEYTGMFKGYNLIMITAEGFSPYAVDEEKTPTLYKLVHEGFIFQNFYTALWQTSTSDGEYVGMTGLIPSGSRSMYKGRHNLWLFSLGWQFDKLGVTSRAYHDHTYTYYQRNETHPNLGYLWKAKGNGLELETDCWPESDLEMINATVDEYTGEEPFHVYYLTVSGHMNYTFIGNSMAYKNKALVADLPYSEDARAYIACQLELDRALEALIKKLEKAGVADHTVIAMSADHYPYGWDKEKLDELAGHEIDPDFEIYRNHFILWCEGMKENIVIDKPCSSLDILPTLSNLFGLKYDSRLLMGQDILSDAEPLVILSNRSFITDKVMYNSSNSETTPLAQEALPENYISNLNRIVKNKFSVSKSILEEDYYRYVFQKQSLGQ